MVTSAGHVPNLVGETGLPQTLHSDRNTVTEARCVSLWGAPAQISTTQASCPDPAGGTLGYCGRPALPSHSHPG